MNDGKPFSLLELIGELISPINVVDIGAMSFGFQTEPYSALQKSEKCKVIGFEPIVEECEKLNQLYKQDLFLPYCLGDGTTKKFHTTNSLMTSSLYPPDSELMGKFENLSELVEVVETKTLKTHRLDDIKEIVVDIDYIKNDTQGAELEIFKHAKKALASAVLVHCEVEFLPIYKEQPLFADIDDLMREGGFVFHKFVNMSGRRFKTFQNETANSVKESQLLWADAIYIKNVNAELSGEKLLKLALLLHDVYSSFDLCHHVLKQYDGLRGTTLANDYEERLLPTLKMQDELEKPVEQITSFQSTHYMRHNQRRQEHLATLGLNLSGKSVLEVGAGIGDHSSFFLDRGCKVTITDARDECLEMIRRRYPHSDVRILDLENPPQQFKARFDIVHCYGVLYHLSNPEKAIKFLSSLCQETLLLETCVSFDNSGTINNVTENINDFTQSFSGTGCRPTRQWVFDQLRSCFPHVYMPTTQPCHEEFPLDWTGQSPSNINNLHRAIFIASRKRLWNSKLLRKIPMKQRHC
ncbi:MAG: FkbM family methyltransferase [Candidatus Obscuribacterales bacterium]|nr:FkbM family methyltransferase [Candidatus Obscuribacterales bacterium]